MEIIEEKLKDNMSYLQSLNEAQMKLALLPDVQKYIVITRRMAEVLEEISELKNLLDITSENLQPKM